MIMTIMFLLSTSRQFYSLAIDIAEADVLATDSMTIEL